MEIKLRLEEEKDYRIVEELTREAFWNVHVPGCDEHFFLHKLRKTEEYIGELDFVALYRDKIVGNIIYTKSKIVDEDREYAVLTFGPISVLPEYQSKGIGAKLIEHTKEVAKEMGYKAVLIYGDPEYYKKFGFKPSKEYHITNEDGKYPAALLAVELYPEAMKGIKGKFCLEAGYEINEKELEEFEKGFVWKEKQETKTQERFVELCGEYL